MSPSHQGPGHPEVTSPWGVTTRGAVRKDGEVPPTGSGQKRCLAFTLQAGESHRSLLGESALSSVLGKGPGCVPQAATKQP